MRRRSDRAAAADEAPADELAQHAATAKAPADKSTLIAALLFLSGCAVGGVGLVALLRTWA